MFDRKETALKVAEFLLQVKAVKLQPNEPFTWASGWHSPIYCDNRVTLSYPHIRTYIRQGLSSLIQAEFEGVEAIAGVATAGIAQGVLVAQDLGLPFAYVRPEPKKHGMTNLIEGELQAGQKVVVIEDLISTGKSSLKVVDALRNAGYEVAGMVSIFTYGFDLATKNFEDTKCRLESLCNYDTLIEHAVQGGYYIKEQDLATLQEWRLHPDTWGQTPISL